MATNYSDPGREYPSREDVYESERRDRERQYEQDRERDRVASYLRNHPSASYAEAEYRTRKK